MTEIKDVVAAVTYFPDREEFLLVKRAESREKFPGKWEFPAGIIENESPKSAAVRELQEETQLLAEMTKEGEPHTVESGYGDFRVHPVLAVVREDDVQLSREHDDYRWVEKKEIEEMETVKGLEKDLENVGIDV